MAREVPKPFFTRYRVEREERSDGDEDSEEDGDEESEYESDWDDSDEDEDANGTETNLSAVDTKFLRAMYEIQERRMERAVWGAV